MSTVFVGRQPIYRTKVSVFAYELLFRSSMVNQADFVDGDLATARVVMNTFVEIGIHQLASDLPIFINATRGFLVKGYLRALPKERVVLEVLEDIRPDEEILEALNDLSSSGYTIALDDFVFHQELLPLVSLADIVKVELPSCNRELLPEHIRRLREYDVRLLAEKVETHEDFDFCKSVGFDYFQGFFFSKPLIITGQEIPASRMAALSLVARLNSPEVDFDEVESMICMEPSLCYKLLRFVNSVVCSPSQRIDSIRQAAVMLGLRRIRTFATLVLMASMSHSKPKELIVVALTRAKMCEILAKVSCNERCDTFFTIGLLSVMDALIDKPMTEVLGLLPLSTEVGDAILHHAGVLGSALNCVEQYERGHWERVAFDRLQPRVITDAYIEATAWASRSAGQLFSSC